VAFKEDKIVGCIFVGNTKGGIEIQGAIERKISVKDIKNAVLEEEFDFGQLR
jgi:hypothetical protein